MEPNKRRHQEIDLAEQAAERMSLEEYARWQRARVAHRVSVHVGCIMVAWHMTAARVPQVRRAALIVTDLQMDAGNGVCIVFNDTWTVGHKPSHLDGLCPFVWVPFFPDVRWEPHPQGEGMVLRVAMAMRFNSHPDHWTAGDTYLTPVGEFRGRFPQFAETKF